MNAPASAAALAEPLLRSIAISALVPSKTHVQELRRLRFSTDKGKQALDELTASIKEKGLLQNLVARPFPAGQEDKFEIIAGERRWIAAKRAGLPKVLVNILSLTDEQVLEVQLIENLQREDLHELEEAEGYEELMKLKKITSEQVAEMVGKSRSYVYARLKLTSLCQELRKVFYEGQVDASTALEIARITIHESQRKAWQHIKRQREYGDLMTVRDVRDYIREEFMLRLKTAPFDLADEKLLPKAGSCNKCPKRSGNQADLFGDAKSTDVCTDTKCFDEKRQAHFAGARKDVESKGKKVIAGDAAKKLLPYWEQGDDELAGGYVKLTDHTEAGKKVAQIVGKDHDTVLIQHPGSGKMIEVVSAQAVQKASGGKARPAGGGSYNYNAASARAKAKGPDVDEMLTERLAQLIHKNAPKAFGKAWLLDLAKVVYEKLNLRDEDAVAKAFGWPASAFHGGYGAKLPSQAAQLDERGLVLLMFHMVFATRWGRERVQKLFGIKEQEVREQIIEERKEAAKKARAEEKAKKEAKAKTKNPVAKVNADIEKPAAKTKPKKKPAAKKAKGKKK